MSNFLSYYKQDKNKELKSMIKFTKILVAFDGSENGLKALEVAEHLTRDNHAELTVLYVHDSPLEYPLSMSATVAGDSYLDRKSTRLNSSHVAISYAVFCLKKKRVINNIYKKNNK